MPDYIGQRPKGLLIQPITVHLRLTFAAIVRVGQATF